jgi:hypothetical protein
MPAWSWWLIFGGIAVLALVVFAVIGLGLWRRAKALFGDIQRLSVLAESLDALTSAPGHTVGTPGPSATAGRHRAHA